ncbi:MAG: efflux RND transporter periplasmic adaptor subunit [Cyanobacteria bacterium P01_G01_bin.19]
MQQKFNADRQLNEFDLEQNDRLVSKSFGDLDRLILGNAFSSEDSPESADLQIQSKFVPQRALYITEIDRQFYFLDHTEGKSNPKPKPIEAGNLATAQLLPTVKSKSKVDLAPTSDTHTQKASLSSFLGNKSLLVGFGLGMLLTLGATRTLFAPAASDRGNTPAPVEEAVAPAQTVTVTEVKTTEIESKLNASGTVAAYESTPVMSQAAGLQITEVLAERGDFVERGQVLARLNDRALLAQKTEAEASVAEKEAALDELQEGSRVEEIAQAEARVASARSAVVEAESDLELSQTRVERNRTLEAEGAIARDRFDEILNQERVAASNLARAQADLNEAQQALTQLKAGSRPQTIAQARAELIQARGRLQGIEAQLEDTVIVAPASGIISSREARVGQIASTSQNLFSIIQNGRLELRLQVPETLIGRIEPEQKVQITSNANSSLNLVGEVREINPTIDDTSRQALVKVDLPSDSNLKPGMFLRAAINTDTNRGVAVPIESLLPTSGNRAIAFVLQDNNRVKAQTVEMGEILDSENVEIVEGLQSGDRLVLEGAAYLKDGDLVRVNN